MDSKTIVEVSAGEAAMLTQLRASPELADRLQALLASARAEQLGEASADEAEERIVAQLRAFGKAAMNSWARQAEAVAVQRLQQRDPQLRPRSKKN